MPGTQEGQSSPELVPLLGPVSGKEVGRPEEQSGQAQAQAPQIVQQPQIPLLGPQSGVQGSQGAQEAQPQSGAQGELQGGPQGAQGAQGLQGLQQGQGGVQNTTNGNVFFQVALYLWNFRFLPLRARWRVNKYKRMLLHPSTPLKLRATLSHARALKAPPEPSPMLFVLRLLWPLPSWHFAATLPPPPRQVMAASAEVGARARDLMFLRSMPLWRARDTPQRALYRLYEAMCANNGPMIKDEVDYIWSRSEPAWATALLEDPHCADPEQYAVLAAVVEELVEAFMGRLEMGRRRHDNPIRNLYRDPAPLVPETCPAWTLGVARLDDPLVLHAGEDRLLDGPFFARNVWASSGYFYTT